MKRVVVDPVTRIEGHLRVEVSVDEGTGQVQDALSSGTAWRGIELVAKKRRNIPIGVNLLWGIIFYLPYFTP